MAAAPATVECGQHWDADFTTNGVNLRSGPGTGYAVVGADCGGGRRSDWWDEIVNRRTGVRGFISQCFVNYDR